MSTDSRTERRLVRALSPLPTWHQVAKGHTEGAEVILRMLYFECRGARYYVGQEGQVSTHPSREE